MISVKNVGAHSVIIHSKSGPSKIYFKETCKAEFMKIEIQEAGLSGLLLLYVVKEGPGNFFLTAESLRSLVTGGSLPSRLKFVSKLSSGFEQIIHSDDLGILRFSIANFPRSQEWRDLYGELKDLEIYSRINSAGLVKVWNDGDRVVFVSGHENGFLEKGDSCLATKETEFIVLSRKGEKLLRFRIF